MLAPCLKKRYQPAELVHTVNQLLAPVYTDKNTQTHLSLQLITHILQCSSTAFFAKDTIEATQLSGLFLAVHNHTKHQKPIDYIVGYTPFAQLTLEVHPPILIPRPETEEWILHVIHELKGSATVPCRILDIGTGSGALALSLATAFKQATVTGIDIHPKSIALAQKNAQKNDIHNAQFFVSDLFSALEGHTFDLMVSNPPYIGRQELLEKSVTLWEDPQALFADDEGLGIIKKIITHAPVYMGAHASKKSQLCIEIGHTQARAVQELLRSTGYSDIRAWKDINQKDRMVSAVWDSNK